MRDQGRGIAKEDHARLFQCFERAVPPQEVSGRGLGLHIASQVALAHGGAIHVDSDLGQGATFVLTLPR